MNHTADDESGTGKALEDIVLCDVSRRGRDALLVVR